MKREIFSSAVYFLYLLLNLFLIIISALVPFYYSVIALTQPETVTAIIQNIDYKTLVKETPYVEAALKDYGIDYKKADEIMKSKKTGKLIALYTDEATEILLSIPENRKFSTALIKELVDENIDTVLNIAEENTNVNIDEKNVKANVEKYINENENELKEFAPVLEQARTIVKQIKLSKIIERTLSLEFMIIFAGIVAVMMIAICFLKRRKFKGFLFLGIDFFAITAALALIILFCKSSFITSLALQMSDFGVSIIESAVSVCTEKILIAAIISGVFTVIFFMFFIVAHCNMNKKPPVSD